MNERGFQISSYVLAAFILIAMFASSASLPDGASWDERFLAFSTAAGPWVVAGSVVWAAGEIIKAMRSR